MRKWVIHEILADAALSHASVPVISGSQRFTYASLYDRSLRLANSLSRQGIGKGTVVGVMDVNSHRYLELKYALSMLGAVIHTINFRLPWDDLVFTVKHAHDQWLFVWEGFGELASRIAQEVPQVVWMGSDRGAGYEDFITAGHSELPQIARSVEETDAYSIFYTTGTTGVPKGISYSHRQMLTGSVQIAHHLGLHDTGAWLRADDVMMPLIPFFHIHGWGVPFIAPYLGAPLVLAEQRGPAEQLTLIEEHRVTWSNMVPTQLFMLLQQAGNKDPNLANLPLKVLTGGSSLSTGLAEQAHRAGVTFSLIYGGSDQLGTAISVAPGLDGAARLRRLSTHMTAFPYVRVEVRNQFGTSVESDGQEMGEVWVQSPWIPDGYADNPEESKRAFFDGWFKSGDLAVRYPDGSFYVMDRLKDAIKSGGEWIASSVIESVISEVPGVKAVAVIGQSDPAWGERPIAIVEAQSTTTRENIRQHLDAAVARGRLAKFWIPDSIRFIESMPLTSAGKIHKAALRQIGSVSSSDFG